MKRLQMQWTCLVVALALSAAPGCESDDSERAGQQEQVEVSEQESSAAASAADGEEAGDGQGAEGEGDADDDGAERDGDAETSGDDDGDAGDDDGDSDVSDDDDADVAGAEGDERADDQETADDEDVDWAQEYGELPIYATDDVATVDGEAIGPRAFNESVKAQLSQIPEGALQAEPAELVPMFLDAIVVSFLLEREVERKKIEVTDAEIDEAIAEFRTMLEMQMGGDKEAVDAMLEQQGVTEAQLRMQAEQELVAEKLITENREISVSDEQARQFYDENQAIFAQEESALVRHILVESQSEAQQLSEELAQGADFAAIAEEHSTCRSAPHGGELGQISREQVVPEFAQVAFSQPVGEVSDPVESSLGWHLIEVHRRQDGGTASFDDVADELKVMLQTQRLQEVALEFIEELRQASEIEVFEDHVVTAD